MRGDGRCSRFRTQERCSSSHGTRSQLGRVSTEAGSPPLMIRGAISCIQVVPTKGNKKCIVTLMLIVSIQFLVYPYFGTPKWKLLRCYCTTNTTGKKTCQLYIYWRVYSKKSNSFLLFNGFKLHTALFSYSIHEQRKSFYNQCSPFVEVTIPSALKANEMKYNNLTILFYINLSFCVI